MRRMGCLLTDRSERAIDFKEFNRRAMPGRGNGGLGQKFIGGK
jgi:hypothetical protein